MKCQVCGAESGKYPLCHNCNELKKQGTVIKCPLCHTWHYRDGLCPAAPDSKEKDLSWGEENAAENAAQHPAVPDSQNAAEKKPVLSEENFRYAPRPSLMSQLEVRFYEAIKLSIPQGFHAYPQVNLAAFIHRTDGAAFQNELFRNVDFLVTDCDYRPRLAIEINDRTHLDRKRKDQDRKVHDILEEAGIPLLTLWASYGIDPQYITCKIQELLTRPPVRVRHSDTQQREYRKDKKQGCYIATCVYGAYDCAPVWTLRRFRDDTLSKTWYGRAFIRLYYAISPMLVRWFGNISAVRHFWKCALDKLVRKLNGFGYTDEPYSDP